MAAKHLVSTPDPRQPEILAVIDRAIGSTDESGSAQSGFSGAGGDLAGYFSPGPATRNRFAAQALPDRYFEGRAGCGPEFRALTCGRQERIVCWWSRASRRPGQNPGPSSWATTVSALGSDDAERAVADGGDREPRPGSISGRGQRASCWAALLWRPPRIRESGKCRRELAGCWAELRHLPEAGAVGLALPRFLLRLPYGKKTSPLESFDFEEFPDTAYPRRLPVGESGVRGRAAARPVLQRGGMGDASRHGDGN